jgi:hypothetical protein
MSGPGEHWDVFVSYAHDDAVWVQTLADNLHRAGLDVFLDAWEIVPGARLSQRLQEGLAVADVVVLVVSAAAVRKPWWQEEFAGAMPAVVAGRQRLIPVLLDEVDVPPFAAARVYIDFRYIDSPDGYEAKIHELVAAVRGQTPRQRPPRDGTIVLPPMGSRAEGPRLARLRITPNEVVFSVADRQQRHTPSVTGTGLGMTLFDLQRAQRHPTGSAGAGASGGDPGAPGEAAVLRGPTGVLHTALVDTGRALGAAFINGVVGQALADQVAEVGKGGASLRLAVQVDDPALADLPRETLVLPGQHTPLVLQAGVDLHRAVEVTDPVAPVVPGPLRILAVVASPDHGGGELLDYEAELARILEAVDASRRRDGAYVHVLNWGTPEAIREALASQRFHVLHISCHAEPGALILESDTGGAVRVTADQFVRDILVPDRTPPLVVLAGCSTALAARTEPNQTDGDEGEGEAVLAGLARDLLHARVPAVLAMTAPVTDRYATDLCARWYQALAAREEPIPLVELSAVRRRLETDRLALPANDPRAAWAEWATPALFQAGPALPLYRRADGVQPVTAPPESRTQLGGMIRKAGDFVGRRAELRAILRDLRGTAGRRRAGVLLHGIGGIGKSSLATELVNHLGVDAGLVVTVSGSTRVDLILEQIRQRLLTHCMTHNLGDGDLLHQLGVALTDATPPWQARLSWLSDVGLPRLPILLLLDNAEDLLIPAGPDAGADVDVDVDQAARWEVRDAELAEFLAEWVRLDSTRLVVTSRYPFTLPGRAERRLARHHLGPLSPAEPASCCGVCAPSTRSPPCSGAAPTPTWAVTPAPWSTSTRCSPAEPPGSTMSPTASRPRSTTAASPIPTPGWPVSAVIWTRRWPRPSRSPPTMFCCPPSSPRSTPSRWLGTCFSVPLSTRIRSMRSVWPGRSPPNANPHRIRNVTADSPPPAS